MNLSCNIRKLVVAFKYFFNADLVWRAPSRCDVLIYDQMGSEFVELLFDDRCKVGVLPIRGESFNITILIISLLMGGWRKESMFSAYVISYVKRVKPRLVITFIDNSRHIYVISKEVTGTKTAFIQNGIRGIVGDVFGNIVPCSSYRVDLMFVFGVDIARQYSKFIEGESIPIGSLKNNMIQARKSAKNKNGKRLAFISQWRPDTRDGTFLKTKGRNITHEDFYSSESVVVKFLSEWTKDNGYSFLIVGSARQKLDVDQERIFYKSLIKSEYFLLSPVESLDSYYQLDRFDLIVYIDSTLGYESLARGKKTAAFSIRGTLLGIDGADFGWPGCYRGTGAFWTNRAEPAEFKKILDYLRDVPDVEWERVRETTMKNIMQYDTDNKMIKECLRRVVEGSSHT